MRARSARRRPIPARPRRGGRLLIAEPRPLRLANVGEHPHSYGFPPGHPPMTTFLGVPILIRGRAWGNLYLTEKGGGEFDEADEQSAEILAEWELRVAAVAGERGDGMEETRIPLAGSVPGHPPAAARGLPAIGPRSPSFS